jgi:hypothetical protein
MPESENPILIGPQIYLQVALKCAVAVAILETPFLFFEVIPANVVFGGGWILVSGYTLYRFHWLSSQSLFVNEFGFIKLIAGLFLLGVVGVALYVTTMASFNPTSNNIWQIKAAFISNPFVALGITTIAVTGTSVADQVRSILGMREL